MEKWIKEELLPQAQATKDQMQAEVEGAAKKVEDCGSLLWSAEKEVEHLEEQLLEDESNKSHCLVEEHRLHKVEMDTCQDLMTFQLNLKSPKNINGVGKTPDPMKEAIDMNYEFYKAMYPQFMKLKGLCVDARLAAGAQHKECEADEEVMEDFYCKLKRGRDEACAAYDTCYKEEVAAMAKKLAKVRIFEAHVKEQFQSMSCFGNAFGEDAKEDEEGEGECNPNAYETNHLDVQYPSKPEKKTCITLMKTRRDYSDVVCPNNVSNVSLFSSNVSAPESAALQ
jgi:hypothetical protein